MIKTKPTNRTGFKTKIIQNLALTILQCSLNKIWWKLLTLKSNEHGYLFITEINPNSKQKERTTKTYKNMNNQLNLIFQKEPKDFEYWTFHLANIPWFSFTLGFTWLLPHFLLSSTFHALFFQAKMIDGSDVH